MVKLQPHKKIVAQSDSRRQASTLAKQSVLPSRDPRTVCMTENDLDILRASFRANRWPERAEKERLAQLISKYVSALFFDIRLRLTPRKVLRKGPSLVLESKAEVGECRKGDENAQERNANSPPAIQSHWHRHAYRRDETCQGQRRGTRNITEDTISSHVHPRGQL